MDTAEELRKASPSFSLEELKRELELQNHVWSTPDAVDYSFSHSDVALVSRLRTGAALAAMDGLTSQL